MAGKPFSRQDECPGSGHPVSDGYRRGLCRECGRHIKIHADRSLYRHVRVYTINYPKVQMIDGGES